MLINQLVNFKHQTIVDTN